MFEALRYDFKRYAIQGSALSPKNMLAFSRHYGLQSIVIYRFGQSLRRGQRRVLLWPLILPGWAAYSIAAFVMRHYYGIDLALSARIGPGLYIGHFGGIELVNCTLGEHCSIGQQTKIGRREDLQGPAISDRVWIGVHTRIYGSICIGEGASLAAGALVTSDVPAKSLALGSPARVIARNYDNSRFLR